MYHYIPTSYTFANEDYEAYINATIGHGPYQCMEFEGLYKIEQLLQEQSIVYSDYQPSDFVHDIHALREKPAAERTEREIAFFQAFQLDDYAQEEALGCLHYPALHKCKTRVIETFVIELSTEHGTVLIVFTSQQESNYKAKIITKDLRALHQEAGKLLNGYLIKERYQAASRENPMLHVVKADPSGKLFLVEVPLKVNRVMSEKVLGLHYGEDILNTQKRLKESLTKEQCGLHLFQGAPGMGKTTFISHLSAELAGLHKLVYVPNSAFERLIAPDNIDFWANACDNLQDGAKIILVVEDAEAILLKREQADNASSSAVSSLLNLCDGLLGQMLGLHVIATANADFQNFDQAILRAGRLQTRHIFKLLTPEAAQELASHLESDVTLPEKEAYTIAEVYNKPAGDEDDEPKRKIGFATT